MSARTQGPQVNTFLIQTEVWAIIFLLSFQARISFLDRVMPDGHSP